MKNGILVVALCAFALSIVGCGGNRYLKTYTGVSSYPKSTHCDLVQVEAQVMYSGYTMDDFLDEYEKAHYEIVGSSSKKQNVEMNARHKRKIESACKKKGGHVALYDNGPRIVYLRSQHPAYASYGDLGEIAPENVPMSKAPFVWLGILATLTAFIIVGVNSR